MKLKSLTLKDKGLFLRYLKYSRHELAVFSFADIFIWKSLFSIFWVVIDRNLCVFFKDSFGTFLYLPPLGKKLSAEAVLQSYDIAKAQNKNQEVTRIENLEEADLEFYRKLKFDCRLKSHDYLSLRRDLADLSGNKLKSQRWSRNYFLKNYDFKFSSLLPKDKAGCLKLYQLWMRMRKSLNSGHIYQGLMEDSLKALDTALTSYRALNFKGSVVRINKEIRGFTFGYELNKDTFCVLYEVTDLSIKGLAQFINSCNCRELKKYKYINVMDDSGLENLKKVKLAYKPVRLIPAYIAKNNESRS